MKWKDVFDIVMFEDRYHRILWKETGKNVFPGLRYVHADKAIEVAEDYLRKLEEDTEKELLK